MTETTKKPRLETAVSPRGVFNFPWLNKPDTKFNKEGVYTTGLLVNAGAAAPFIAKIDAAIQAKLDSQVAEMVAKGGKAIADSKKVTTHAPYQPEYDKEGNETGRIKFTAKVNAEGSNDKGDVWSNKPAIFDAAGTPTTVAIFGGSEGKVSVQLVPYYSAKDNQVGITLRLKAAQVLKLVSRNSDSAEGFGFGFGAEDGYVADEQDEPAPKGEDFSTGDDTASDDTSSKSNDDF